MSTQKIFHISKCLKFVQNWLLPPTCLLCNRPGQQGLDLCLHCLATFKVISLACTRCGLPLNTGTAHHCGFCFNTPHPVKQLIAPWQYASPLSELITAFKYRQQLAAGRMLTQLLAQQIQQHYTPANLPQLIVPVPLHHKRLKKRGYNQAGLIAHDLGKALNIPVNHALLTRQLETATQQGLTAQQRKLNLQNAFSVTQSTQLSQYLRVVVVDDVVTTMSTAIAVANTLQLAHKNLEIHVWSLSRALLH